MWESGGYIPRGWDLPSSTRFTVRQQENTIIPVPVLGGFNAENGLIPVYS